MPLRVATAATLLLAWCALAAARAWPAEAALADPGLGPHLWTGRAATQRGETRPLRLAVVADVQKGLPCFRRMAGAIAALDPPAEAVVFTGDMVSHADPGHYALFLQALHSTAQADPRLPPCLFVPGNHDLLPGGGRPARHDLYERAFGPREWAVQAGDSLLVCLDTALGPPDEAARTRLRERLRGSHASRALLLTHDAPPDWVSLLPPEGAPGARVELVLAGHRHRWHEETAAGAHLIVNGEGADSPAGLPGGRARWLVVDAGPDGFRVETRYVDRAVGLDGLPWELRHLWWGHAAPVLRGPLAAALLLAATAAAAAGRIRRWRRRRQGLRLPPAARSSRAAD